MIELYNKYKDQGFEVLFFPCKQFGSGTEGQEPGTRSEMQKAYLDEYKIPFTIFDFVQVNGPQTHPIYKFLRSAELKNQNSDKNAIEWNFGKFIVGRSGQVLKRYGPAVPPESLDSDEKIIEWLKPE